MGPPSKRIQTRLILTCFVIGIILNVGVAWMCSVRSGVGPHERAAPEESKVWKRYAMAQWPAQPEFAFIARNAGSLVTSVTAETPDKNFSILELRAGWPALSMKTAIRVQHGLAPDWICAWKLPWNVPSLGVSRGRMLPLGPIWHGMLINTIFYAAAVWLVIRTPAEARRRWRELHGLCPVCEYPREKVPTCMACGADQSRAWKARLLPLRLRQPQG